MRDSIRMKNDEFYFKFRAAGLIIKNNKILIVEMDNNGYYCLPGGYVEMGETTEEAVKRELKEEFGQEVKVIKYLGMVENYFVTKSLRKMHEISCYYLLDLVDENILLEDKSLLENDNEHIVRLDFKWVDLNELDNYDVRPVFLKELVKGYDLEFKHLIFDNLYM